MKRLSRHYLRRVRREGCRFLFRWCFPPGYRTRYPLPDRRHPALFAQPGWDKGRLLGP